ncbi:MAG: hypothetical protein Q9170_007053 [Blastenia crenularia]
MPKRKRESEDVTEIGRKKLAHRDLREQGRRLESLLERSKQMLLQALKLARGFERQKLGRRQKTAKAANDEGDSKRLAIEVVALKDFAEVHGQSLNMYTIAEIHLYKSMLKTKSIASAPSMPLWIKPKLDELSKPQHAAHANVQARLFNSQPVKKAMDDVFGNLRISLGLDESQNGKRKRMRKADYQQETRDNTHLEGPDKIYQDDHNPDDDDNAKMALTSESRLPDQANKSDKSNDYDGYDTRIAESSEDSFGRSYDLRTKPHLKTSRSISLSPSPDFSEPVVPSEQIPSRSARASKKASSNANATTFLPSLSMGGYWSGSEPATDDEGGVDDTQRKNRRGQQERRLIAEKKHGQNAKHLREKNKASGRDKGWDARKGAQIHDGRGNRGRNRGGSNHMAPTPHYKMKGAASSSGANSDPVESRRATREAKEAEGPLHPSWQAAKSAKEQKKAAIFQGKKVLFD